MWSWRWRTVGQLWNQRGDPNLGPFLLWMFGLGFEPPMNRRFAAAADPVFLPIALLLDSLGYVVITRLDGGLAALQSAWTAIG